MVPPKLPDLLNEFVTADLLVKVERPDGHRIHVPEDRVVVLV